ncbi:MULTISPECIES: hypothetical protein [Xanthomonas]|uniref:hypothetical protein n=1 Tax=Xanthomonas TaxID=338 RepID=UPI000536F233|nr:MULTISPECIES: hypothetical protein [Xanthomonas]KGT55053.1 hypothetical protein NY96_13915 [Xanthomonas citri pv. fuscans]KGU43198.1 hypothetical protein NY95_09185 [Xanthomonas citri pv. fuscans]KGU47934.1 hypothetical protein NY94_04205 [Xanthomonas phaseoli pv. phaseoli]
MSLTDPAGYAGLEDGVDRHRDRIFAVVVLTTLSGRRRRAGCTYLEPSWSLISDHAYQQGLVKTLAWKDRLALASTRIGALADYNLAWQRGSVLNRISEERADAPAALVRAARDARGTFGDQAE